MPAGADTSALLYYDDSATVEPTERRQATVARPWPGATTVRRKTASSSARGGPPWPGC